MSKKVFIAEQETLLEVQEQVEKLVRNLVPDDAPIYGMVIHEASDLNPSTRVEYLGANKDFTPMSMNMSTHAIDKICEALDCTITDLLEYIPNERKTTGKYLILEEHGNRKQKKEKD